MKHECISGLECGTQQFLKSRVRVRWDSAIKKLLKIFLFIFSIKIFLKNTLLYLDSQNKERRRQETQNKKEKTKEVTNTLNKIKEGQFRMFGPHSKPISACFGLFWPFWSRADTTRFG